MSKAKSDLQAAMDSTGRMMVAWKSQRVNEGELQVAFVEATGGFAYVQPADGRGDVPAAGEPIELSPEPSWGRVAYNS